MFRLGKDCLCRRDAPSLGGLVCPLCWRCSGLAVGVFLALTVVPVPWRALEFEGLAGAALACWLPALIDVLAQVGTGHAYRSHRWTRLVTGVGLGVGVRPVGLLVTAWFP